MLMVILEDFQNGSKKFEAVQKIETVDQLVILFEAEEATRVTNFYSSNPGKFLSGENYFYKYEVYERANKEFIDIKDIQHYLSFLFIENKLMASVVTIDELSSYSEVPYLFRSHKDRRNNKTAPIEEINKNLSSQNNFGEKYQNVLNRIFNRLNSSIPVPIISSFCLNT